MVEELIILPEAELDIVEAYDWYEERELGLGEEFLRCVDACIQYILRHPEAYQMIYEEYRRALVRRFPYGGRGRAESLLSTLPFGTGLATFTAVGYWLVSRCHW
ncbi:MAG: hypothetical protein EBE86_032680 [Hormoscilla sp. GUM202]|nr:hypothetical protein [Hormoscilla sp. GUM202]